MSFRNPILDFIGDMSPIRGGGVDPPPTIKSFFQNPTLSAGSDEIIINKKIISRKYILILKVMYKSKTRSKAIHENASQGVLRFP